MNKTLLIKSLLIVIMGIGFTAFVISHKNQQSILPNDVRCNQSATTTPCSALISLMDAPTPTPPKFLTASSTATWKEYSNVEAGIMYEYPDYETSYSSGGFTGPGEQGRIAGVTISLPSGARIEGYATSRDFATAKDGFGISTMGYEVRDGKYYAVWANGMGPSFVPDDVWVSKDGFAIPVIYGKEYDARADYPEAAIKAYVNLPGPIFSGMGFILMNMDDSGSHPATPQDVMIFKRLVASIRFLK